MPDSSSEDQLDAGVLSGEQPSCSAALTTDEEHIRVCWHGGMFQRAVCGVSALQNITPFGRACHISTLWHLEHLQEGSGGWGAEETEKEYITGGLCSHCAKSLPGVCHAELSM